MTSVRGDIKSYGKFAIFTRKIKTKDRKFHVWLFGKNGLNLVKIGGGGVFRRLSMLNSLAALTESCKDSEFTVTFDATPKNDAVFKQTKICREVFSAHF